MSFEREEIVWGFKFCFRFGAYEPFPAASLSLVALNHNRAGVVSRIKI